MFRIETEKAMTMCEENSTVAECEIKRLRAQVEELQATNHAKHRLLSAMLAHWGGRCIIATETYDKINTEVASIKIITSTSSGNMTILLDT